MRHAHRADAATQRTADRRAVLKAAIGGLAGVALPSLAITGCGSSSGPGYAAASLTDRLTLLAGAGGNVLVFAADEGAMLVDAGRAESASALRAAVRDLGAWPVRAVVNTHYHPDQTGGNETLARSGADVVAHERTRIWMTYDYWVPAEDRYEKARPRRSLPTRTFYQTTDITTREERLDCGYLIHAHTDGDVYAYFREANVIAVGDVLSPERDIAFDWFAGGWIGGRLDALAHLIAITDADTRIVPAYGPVLTRDDLMAEHAMIETLFERVHLQFRQGFSARDMLEAGALEGLGRDFDDPGKLIYDIHKGLWGHQSSLSPDIL